MVMVMSLRDWRVSFSALQRAENSSMVRQPIASPIRGGRFSALQRAENSSMVFLTVYYGSGPQVSVLFSEPKIPQSTNRAAARPSLAGFSALQRAENSSIDALAVRRLHRLGFQCSSASRKFLNARR